jgi:hypothetical protein
MRKNAGEPGLVEHDPRSNVPTQRDWKMAYGGSDQNTVTVDDQLEQLRRFGLLGEDEK